MKVYLLRGSTGGNPLAFDSYANAVRSMQVLQETSSTYTHFRIDELYVLEAAILATDQE